MNRHVVLAALGVRIAIALLTRTFFQPDEYFQSLEVAHHLVFGYGHLTWEWLTPQPIRSILYPALNVPVYYALKVLRLDGTEWLIWGPKILHGAIAALTDIWLCRLTKQVIGERYVLIALLLSLTSLFHGLALSRSLSNSAETSLTTVALSYFPWDTHASGWRRSFRVSLSVAAVACAVRPTNAVLWVYMVAFLAWRHRKEPKRILAVAADVALIGSVALGALCTLDSLYYGKLTFTPLNFLRTNLSSISLFYGSSPWHYYLSQGVVVLATIVLPFSLHGIFISATSGGTPAARSLLGLVLWTITIYSLAGHKEWRFIHPLLPILHIFAARSIVDVYHRKQATRSHGTKKRAPRPAKLPISRAHLALVLLNIPPLLYLMFAHGRAQIDAIHVLRALPAARVRSAGFLMPCHSTPWHAYLHTPAWAAPGRVWALGCEPPLAGDAGAYGDQTDVFYAAPAAYLRTRFPRTVDRAFPPSPNPFTPPGSPRPDASARDWKHEWPEYVVAFGALLREPGVAEVLAERGYRVVWHGEGGWEGDARRRGGVVVMKVE
ncbi:glycosyltransferase family 22 protein [Phanerochaete sordida]|uniref:Mannosyltransferase n=1 Tax=Phanerochaete sordida TaxID=48140 RepID=A0A9P3GA25_9APHY|nr:glycosyltransferase family 22 protein [Phanerochaete sordida]